MATVKYTPAISISQIASYLSKITNCKYIEQAKDLDSLQELLNECELETPLPGLGNGVMVMTERINIRAALFSMNAKTKLMDAVIELEDMASDDYSPSMTETWVPLLVCDDALSGIDSLFILYGVHCTDGYATNQVCKMFLNELTASLDCPAMPTVLMTNIPIKAGRITKEYVAVMAVHAKSLLR